MRCLCSLRQSKLRCCIEAFYIDPWRQLKSFNFHIRGRGQNPKRRATYHSTSPSLFSTAKEALRISIHRSKSVSRLGWQAANTVLGPLTRSVPNFEKLHRHPRTNLAKFNAIIPCPDEDMMPNLDCIIDVCAVSGATTYEHGAPSLRREGRPRHIL